LEGLEDCILKMEKLLREMKSKAKKMKKSRKNQERGKCWIDSTYVKGCGPYYRLRWVENGEKKCIYLGKSPDLKKLPKILRTTFVDVKNFT